MTTKTTLLKAWVMTVTLLASFTTAFFRGNGVSRHRFLLLDTEAGAATAAVVGGKGHVVAPKVVDSVNAWLTHEPIARVLPREDFKLTLDELNANAAFWEKNKPTFEKYWDRVEDTFRKEKRSLRQILGDKAVNGLLQRIESWDIYEPTTVRAFLQNAAFEDMMGGILYEGIFMFIQRVDIVGNIIDKIPVLGPVRKLVITEFKSQLDKTVGGQVKGFLSTFNRIAVERMIEYILSPKNRPMLQKANRAVAQSLLERPFSSIGPDRKTSLAVRDRLWQWFRAAPPSEFVALFDAMYTRLGTKALQDFGDVQQVIDVSPTARKILEDNVARFLETPDGVALLKDLALAALSDE